MNTTTPHPRTDACGDDHCYGCDLDEPLPPPEERLPGATICVECFHYYPSGEALLEAYRVSAAEVYAANPEWGPAPPAPTDAAEVYFCQLCLHDF